MSSGGMTLERLQVLIEAETKPFREELSRMQSQLSAATNQVERQTSKIKRAVSGIKSSLVGFGIGAALFKVGKDSIKFASDLQEVQNVVDTAFEDMSYKCESFAKNSLKQFGMSELSAKKTASTYMAMAKGIGMAAEPASDMAINLAGLTGDVASFFNISQDLAATKLKSIFTGETETLKDLGIVMTQANLKQYAMKNGISDNIEAMDQASLTALRYRFVTDQLALAQGDFAKTSGSWANQTRILSEQWKQLMGIIGNGLVAIFTPVVRVLNEVLGKIIQFAKTVQAVLSGLFSFGKKKDTSKVTKSIASSIESAASNTGGLNNQLDKTTNKAKKAAKAMGQLAGFDEINNLTTPNSSGDAGGSAIGDIGNVGGIDTSNWGINEFDTSGIDKTVEKIRKKLDELKKFIQKYKAPIVASMAGIVAALGTLWTIKHWNTLVGPIKNLFINLMSLIAIIKDVGIFETFSTFVFGVSSPMLAVASSVGVVVAALVYLWHTSDEFRNNVIKAVKSVMDILNNIYNNVLKPLFDFLTDFLNTALFPIAIFLSDVAVTAVDLIATVILELWNNVLAPIVDFLVDILAIALQGIIDIWEAWKPAIEIAYASVQWIWDTILKPIVDWIKNTLIKRFEEWGNLLDELLPHIEDMFKGLIDFFVGIFTGNMEKCWQGIEEIFKGFDEFLASVFTTDWTKSFGVLGNILNIFFQDLKVIWNGIKTVFKGIIEFITGVFTGDWKKAWNGVKTIFKGVWDSLLGIVKNIWNRILGLFTNGGKIFKGVASGIATTFKNIVNNLISGINRVISWPFNEINSMLNNIRSISILGHKPFKGLWGYNPLPVPQIPFLARGTIATHAMPAVFGEAGAEAVVPLENHTGWMAKIAKGITGYMGHSDGFAEDINDLIIIMQEVRDGIKELINKDTDVYLDGERISDIIAKLGRYKKLRTG